MLDEAFSVCSWKYAQLRLKNPDNRPNIYSMRQPGVSIRNATRGFSVDSLQQMDRPTTERDNKTCTRKYVNCYLFSNERLFMFKILAISMSVVISYESPADRSPTPFLCLPSHHIFFLSFRDFFFVSCDTQCMNLLCVYLMYFWDLISQLETK